MTGQIPVTYVQGTQPKIGDIAKGTDIGKKSKCKYVLVSCKQCSKTRWTKFYSQDRLCSSCSMKNRNRDIYFKHGNQPPTYIIGNKPRIGDIAMGRDIGKGDSIKYVWATCQSCGAERWVNCSKRTKLCLDCRNKSNGKHRIPVTYVRGNIPKLSDVALGEDIRRKAKEKYLWSACTRCGAERWVKYHDRQIYCFTCSQRNRSAGSYKASRPANYAVGTTPKINDIARGRDIGKRHSSRYIWSECHQCSKGRWLVYRTNDSHDKQLCPSCSASGANRARYQRGVKNGRWRGGRMVSSKGYVSIKVYKDEEPFFAMASVNGYILEHRLVMARYLGRCLTKKEVVHHKNGDRVDNRLENLKLTGSISEHSKEHSKGYSDGFTKGYRDGSNKRIKELELEVSLYQSIIFADSEKETVH